MNSKLLVIAKRDFIEAARSRLLWGAVLVLLVVTIPDYLGMIDGDLVRSMQQAVRFMPMVFQYFVAPVAMITAYKAVVGERESGSLRVLFGHPATRRDLVLGKLISRSALLVVILSIATLGLGIVTMATYGSLDFSLFGAILGYIALYGVVWAGITVGISAAASSRLQAITGVLGLFLFFGPFQLWNRLALPVFSLLFTGSTSMSGINSLRPSTWPAWYQYVLRLNPMSNFVEGRIYLDRLIDPAVPASGHHMVNLFGWAILVAWCVVPVLLGYWRFERADFG
jgi:ABC-2 type transport system permease protein